MPGQSPAIFIIDWFLLIAMIMSVAMAVALMMAAAAPDVLPYLDMTPFARWCSAA